MNEDRLVQNESDYRAPASLSSFFAGLASQVLVIAAVLYYFGWLEARTYFGYFSVDTALLGFSTTDYMLRSINIVFPALVVAAIIAIAALGMNHAISVYLSESHVNSPRVRYMRALLVSLRLGAALLTGLALIGIIVGSKLGDHFTIWLPLLLLTSSALFLYSLRTADALKPNAFSSSSVRRLQYQLTLLLVVITSSWGLSLYAVQIGEQSAVSLANRIYSSPSVLLYSTQRLAIAGPGVSADEITQTGLNSTFALLA